MPNSTQSYQWTGMNPQGKRTTGTIRAADSQSAQSELNKMGIEIISLEQKRELHILKRQKKIKTKSILLFTRYLSTMMAAGLPIVQAMDIISHDQENPVMQNLVTSLKNDISSGKTLAESFSKHPECFNKLYCSLIKAGEKSGTLDKILLRLADYMEKTETLKRKIKKALIYPTAIIIVATVVSLILLIFVVPKFQAMFATFGAKLPLFTRMVVNLSDGLRSYWWVIAIVIIAIILGIKNAARQSDAIPLLIDRWKLKIIVIGPVVKKGIIARYTRTLATTLEAGMPIVESMRSIPEIMDNRIYGAAIAKICDEVASGIQLSVAMESSQLFPNMAIQMIAVGEVSGSLADMLNKVADYYEEEVNTVVDNLSSLLEPLIMAVLGVIIGGFVIAMYLPIFKMGSLF